MGIDTVVGKGSVRRFEDEQCPLGNRTQETSVQNHPEASKVHHPGKRFYEWEAVEGRKKPLYVKMKDDNTMLFAGLWDHWEPSTSQ
jgi:hypothetical protein